MLNVGARDELYVYDLKTTIPFCVSLKSKFENPSQYIPENGTVASHLRLTSWGKSVPCCPDIHERKSNITCMQRHKDHDHGGTSHNKCYISDAAFRTTVGLFVYLAELRPIPASGRWKVLMNSVHA